MTVGYKMEDSTHEEYIYQSGYEVSDLIDPSSGLWNKQRLDELFYFRDMNLILKRKSVTSQEDYWVWDHARNGAYTVKFGNWLASQEENHMLIQEMAALPSINSLREEILSTQHKPSQRSRIFSGEPLVMPLWWWIR